LIFIIDAFDPESLLQTIDGTPTKLVEFLFENFLLMCTDIHIDGISDIYDAFSESAILNPFFSDLTGNMELISAVIPIRQYAITKKADTSNESSSKPSYQRPNYSLHALKIAKACNQRKAAIQQYSDSVFKFCGFGHFSHSSKFIYEDMNYISQIVFPRVPLIAHHECTEKIRRLSSAISFKNYTSFDSDEKDEEELFNPSTPLIDSMAVDFNEDNDVLTAEEFEDDDESPLEEVEYFSSSDSD
jgi:hypothetical protein